MKQLKPSQAARASFEPLAEHEIRMGFWRKWNSVVLSTESLLSTELWFWGYKNSRRTTSPAIKYWNFYFGIEYWVCYAVSKSEALFANDLWLAEGCWDAICVAVNGVPSFLIKDLLTLSHILSLDTNTPSSFICLNIAISSENTPVHLIGAVA